MKMTTLEHFHGGKEVQSNTPLRCSLAFIGLIFLFCGPCSCLIRSLMQIDHQHQLGVVLKLQMTGVLLLGFRVEFISTSYLYTQSELVLPTRIPLRSFVYNVKPKRERAIFITCWKIQRPFGTFGITKQSV